MSGDFSSRYTITEHLTWNSRKTTPLSRTRATVTDSEKSKDMLHSSISFDFSESVVALKHAFRGCFSAVPAKMLSQLSRREKKSPDTGSPSLFQNGALFGTETGNGLVFLAVSRL